MKVLKFGGTSVGTVKNIEKVISILADYSKKQQTVCVVSAFSGITDMLLAAGKQANLKDESYKETFKSIKSIHRNMVNGLGVESTDLENVLTSKFNDLNNLLDGIFLINELSLKTSDKLVSFGEMLSSLIISETAKARGLDASLKNSQELIKTNSDYSNATVKKEITYDNIISYFKKNSTKVVILPGFIAQSTQGESTTLGRGGSDFTASLLAAALGVDELEIWTDVSGMYTTNPKLVKQAFPITYLSYQEAMELSHFGAKVLYPPTIQPVLDKNISIKIKNTFKPDDPGTTIGRDSSEYTKYPVKGISNINNIALLTLEGSGMVGIPGFSKRLFETLANERINIVMITQASSEHSICFGISQNEADIAKEAIDKHFSYEISLNRINPLVVEKDLAIIALIGDNMKNHQGISGRMFSTLGKNNINIRAIAQGASEKNISAVIDQEDVKKALNSLHERFFESKTKQLNVFITGVGNVGQRLIDQIATQKEHIKKALKINMRVVGLSSSRTMVFDEGGLDLTKWAEELSNGEDASLEGFFERVKTLNLRNSIFVDITADENVAKMYRHYLMESIAVVACNKIASSSEYKEYQNLKELSSTYNAPYLFETNVGAGLPVIDTLNNLINSGDKVRKIQAVLSGSLNFIFNNYNEDSTFYSVVKKAQEEGYTEPDPRIDLSGVDVARKILILARESGFKMELEDIENKTFLSEDNLRAGSVDEFYKSLEKDEIHFKELYASAKSNNCRLKYVAELIDGKASVGLKEIPVGHPFYNLEGKDNIVMFYTKRYSEQPLIVKGAGAGADVTASGLFADIIRVSNN